MNAASTPPAVRMIPVDQIKVLNPRARGRAKFSEIVDNISRIGLKKPITVSRRNGADGAYDLVCGQGRLEAFQALGQTEVPAIVLDVSKEDRYIMSLVENIARRKRTTMESVRELVALGERGYSPKDIAEKVGLSDKYVRGLLRLHAQGEQRLILAVERGDIPVNIAIDIAGADDVAVQRSLTEAYEKGELRGKALLKARNLVEERRVRGKAMRSGTRKTSRAVSADEIVRLYKRETQRQDLLVRKARLCEEQLLFLTTALRDLLADENFVTLLRAEGLDKIPQYLTESGASRS